MLVMVVFFISFCKIQLSSELILGLVGAEMLIIADAQGVDGEGLQIKEGEIDWKELFNLMNIYCPNASFIPEIWQGHKNRGEGAWMALERLENFCSTTQNNASVA